MSGKLDGKVALITGGAGGIGGAIAHAYAAAGATVVIADMSQAAARDVAGSIGGAALGLGVDVTSADSVDAMVRDAVAAAGRIDILVNGAGIFGFQPWGDIAAEDFDRIFAVNVRGLMLATQATAAAMGADGGAIINIASGAGRRGNPLTVAYSASKAAVISLTQSAALAYAKTGIRVNAIAPGGVQTAMWDKVDAQYSAHAGGEPGSMTRNLVATIPLGRMSQPDDYTSIALFLACDDSRYMTGQTVNVDGGLFLN